MVHDRISNLSHHDLPHVADIVAFLKANDAAKLPVGKIEIMDRDLFVSSSEYETKRREDGRFETHRIYADLQLVVHGSEVIETAPLDALEPLTDYDPKTDCRFFRLASITRLPASDVLLHSDEFAYFPPGWAHKPGCSAADVPVSVKKLVFKIRVA